MTGGIKDLNMPNCTLYKRCRYQFKEKKKNVTILIVGNPGTGKSETGLKIGKDLDPTFDKTRIVNSVGELVSLVHTQKLKPGAAILFDEIAGSEEGADSRRSLSKTNLTLSYISTIARVKRLIIIYCCPYLTQMDKRVRLIGVTAIIDTKDVDFEKKVCISSLYWVHSSGKTGKQYTPKPRISINGIPHILQKVNWKQGDKKLVEEYQEIKNKFVDSSFENWDAKLNAPQKEKEDMVSLMTAYALALPKITELINEKNKVIVASLLTKIPGLTEKKAAWLRASLQADIDSKRIEIPTVSSRT